MTDGDLNQTGTANCRTGSVFKGPLMNTDAATLRAIRRRVAAAPHSWVADTGDRTITLKAVPHNHDDDPFPSPYATLALHDWDVAEFLFSAHGDLQFTLALLDRAIARMKTGMKAHTGTPPRHQPPAQTPRPEKVDRQKDYAGHCAMACARDAFKRFLAKRYQLTGDLPDKAETEHLIRHTLGITSRSELNAAGQWLALNHEFQQWLKQPMEEGR